MSGGPVVPQGHVHRHGVVHRHGLLRELAATGLFTPLDLAFAAFAAKFGGGDGLVFGALAASSASAGGGVCVDLAALAGTVIGEGDFPLRYPGLAAWREALRSSPAVGVPGDFRPLILDDSDRLYLHRYHAFESRLAAALGALADGVRPGVRPADLAGPLAALFPADDGEDTVTVDNSLRSALPDAPMLDSGINGDKSPRDDNADQKLAAAVAAAKRFLILTGGPGTGKTTTVARILALLFAVRGPAFRVVLTAPTGKAAARLAESVRRAKLDIVGNFPAAASIPEACSTVHRLLGAIPGRSRFRYGREFPLPVDLLVVDEASMLDLTLTARLVDALPSAAGLILVGDRDQLASVDPGAVLGDLCGAPDARRRSDGLRRFLAEAGCRGESPVRDGGSPLGDCVVTLRRSRRFGDDSPIGRFARAVNTGDADRALDLLERDGSGALSLVGVSTGDALDGALAPAVDRRRGWASDLTAPAVLKRLDTFMTLAVLREGPFGVRALNARTERLLTTEGVIRPHGPFYIGRPILVTRNDAGRALYNGDLGIVLPDADGQPRVFFPGAVAPRAVHPLRLPEHETAWAITVHKSQGSEFDEILLVLPPDPDCPILTRELLYTAATRARNRVTVVGTACALRAAVARRTVRSSGLADALWTPAARQGGSTPAG